MTDEEAVRELYQQLVRGWNAGDGAQFAAAFADDGDLVAFDGTHFRSRAVIQRAQQELFDRWVKGTRLIGEVSGVRFLGPDAALMHARGGTIPRGKRMADPARDSLQTLVATRTAEGWRLAAFQNTRVRPMGSGFLAFLHWTIGDRLWRWLRLSTEPSPAAG